MIKLNIFHALFLLLLTVPYLKAQEQERYIHNDPFTYTQGVASLDSSIYVNKAYNDFFNLEAYEQWLLKLDMDLNTTDSINLGDQVDFKGYRLDLFNLKEHQGNELLVMLNEFYYDTLASGQVNWRYHNHFLRLDKDLNILDNFSIKHDTLNFRLLDAVKFEANWLLLGFVRDTTNMITRTALVQMDTSGNLYNMNFYDISRDGSSSAFWKIHVTDSLFVLSLTRFWNPIEALAIVDHQFNLLSLKPTIDSVKHIGMFHSGHFIDVPGKLPVLLSPAFGQTSPVTPPSIWMGVGHIDSAMKVTQIDTFPFFGPEHMIPSGGIDLPSTVQGALAYTTADSAFFCMAGYQLYGTDFWREFQNDIFLYNYNAVNESMNWMKVYNSGYTNASDLATAVLPGNKYLLALNEYNWDKYSYDNTSIHLMIFNSNGDILSQKEPEMESTTRFLTIYPMPFSNQVSIEGLPAEAKNLYYKLVGVDGKEITSGHISDEGEIQFGKPLSGQFILRIFSDGELIQSLPVVGR